MAPSSEVCVEATETDPAVRAQVAIRVVHQRQRIGLTAFAAACAAAETRLLVRALVDNHDPKPLRRESAATHHGSHTWDHLASGPEFRHVRIGKAAVGA